MLLHSGVAISLVQLSWVILVTSDLFEGALQLFQKLKDLYGIVLLIHLGWWCHSRMKSVPWRGHGWVLQMYTLKSQNRRRYYSCHLHKPFCNNMLTNIPFQTYKTNSSLDFIFKDELTTINVKQGFTMMPQLPDEFGTARNCNVIASKVCSVPIDCSNFRSIICNECLNIFPTGWCLFQCHYQ